MYRGLATSFVCTLSFHVTEMPEAGTILFSSLETRGLRLSTGPGGSQDWNPSLSFLSRESLTPSLKRQDITWALALWNVDLRRFFLRTSFKDVYPPEAGHTLSQKSCPW